MIYHTSYILWFVIVHVVHFFHDVLRWHDDVFHGSGTPHQWPALAQSTRSSDAARRSYVYNPPRSVDGALRR